MQQKGSSAHLYEQHCLLCHKEMEKAWDVRDQCPGSPSLSSLIPHIQISDKLFFNGTCTPTEEVIYRHLPWQAEQGNWRVMSACSDSSVAQLQIPAFPETHKTSYSTLNPGQIHRGLSIRESSFPADFLSKTTGDQVLPLEKQQTNQKKKHSPALISEWQPL